ncbi:hypothetical protein L6164_025880 [Bauhinia variegata]|uniref:Uncharacterized protein n=1 Tax=Bauhinia variegata TaxID=167791 RepID=A0ACB9M3D7_BAUVA|nr:hypothetical protein L6164_025880 [Bauhinia variegata]
MCAKFQGSVGFHQPVESATQLFTERSMAERVDNLLKKLNECAKVVPKEISPHLLKMGKVFEQALQHLSGDIEWRRESNDALEKQISRIIDLVQAVEYIIDWYFLQGQSIFTRKSEIYFKMRQFLHKDARSGKVLPFALDRISGVVGQFTGPSFLDMLKNFSDQVCSHLKRLLWQIALEDGHSDFNLMVQFRDELDGWVKIVEVSCVESELTSLEGSKGETIEFVGVKIA